MRGEASGSSRAPLPNDEDGWARAFEALPEEVRAAIDQGVAEDMRALADEEAQRLADAAAEDLRSLVARAVATADVGALERLAHGANTMAVQAALEVARARAATR